MKVIMIHNIGGVGRQNEIKEVADGYALNFLIPNGHAVHATADKIKALNERMALAKRTADDHEKKTLQGIERLRGASVTLHARANDAGGLYRDITPDMICSAISSAYGVHVPAADIQLHDPIKKVGQHTITVRHGKYATDVRVIITKQ